MPADVEGTSIETLSVSISNRLSPGSTASPADLNHLVILPSATVSPSCGISTFMVNGSRRSRDPLPDNRGVLCLNRPQNQAVTGKLISAHDIAAIARLHAGMLVMRHRAGALINRIGAEIGHHTSQRRLGVRRGELAATWSCGFLRRDVDRHMARWIIEND